MARQDWKWDPLAEIDALHREIDRIFGSFGDTNAGWLFPFSRTSFLPGRSAQAYPLMNLSEDENNLYIEALAPGLDPETLNITVTGKTLSLSGEKRALPKDLESFDFHRNERGAGRFARTVQIEVPIDEGKIKAEYKNGLILLTLPKAEAAKPKEIAVKVS